MSDDTSQYELSVSIPPGVSNYELEWSVELEPFFFRSSDRYMTGAIRGPETWTVRGRRHIDGALLQTRGVTREEAESRFLAAIRKAVRA